VVVARCLPRSEAKTCGASLPVLFNQFKINSYGHFSRLREREALLSWLETGLLTKLQQSTYALLMKSWME